MGEKRREMNTKIIGVSFEGRQEHCKLLKEGQKLWPLEEKDNPFDADALKLFADEAMTMPLGYVQRELAGDIARQRSKGWTYEFYVSKITGGAPGRSIGVNITIVAISAE